MDVFEKFHEQYAAACLAGYELGDAYKDLVTEYQTRWDAGDRFDLSKISPVDMMNPDAWKRDPADEARELSACLAELAGKLKTALLEKWAKNYSQSQMQGIVNALAALDWDGKMVIHGMDVKFSEVVTAWNNVHPEAECEVYLDSGFEI